VLLADDTLPFTFTLITNTSEHSADVKAHRKLPRSKAAVDEPLGLAWPRGIYSLAHIALPFPPDDPLYGQRPPDNEDILFLGQMAVQGERGLLPFPADWLLRLRYNPFYDFLELRTLEWIDDTNQASS
jgi:hypothetical protein